MGAFLSSPDAKDRRTEYTEVSCGETCKRQRMLPIIFEENSRLIPGLPDEIAMQIFARLPRVCYLGMKLVSRNWKAAFMSPELFNTRKELGLTEEWLYMLIKVKEDELLWYALDPRARIWQKLPPMPSVTNKEESTRAFSILRMWTMLGPNIDIANLLRRWLGRREISGQLPLCGCATGAVNGCLYVLGGLFGASAMNCVWRYDPVLNAWSEVNSMLTSRAYCKTGVLNNKLHVVGGVNGVHGGLIPLQSAEVFDPFTGMWSELPSMPFSGAQALPSAFLADTLKPIATGMTAYRGKLCVPQSLYSWPFFVDVGGEIYDSETNSWIEMPSGLGEGWPARQAGTKLSAVVDGELYAFDPSSSLNSGKIKVYDQKDDAWKVIIEKVPSCDFTASESPYLLASFHGKLHFITKEADHKIVVLRADVWDNLDSFSAVSSSVPSHSLYEHSNCMAESERVIWNVVGRKNFDSAELVSCQVLDT